MRRRVVIIARDMSCCRAAISCAARVGCACTLRAELPDALHIADQRPGLRHRAGDRQLDRHGHHREQRIEAVVRLRTRVVLAPAIHPHRHLSMVRPPRVQVVAPGRRSIVTSVGRWCCEHVDLGLRGCG